MLADYQGSNFFEETSGFPRYLGGGGHPPTDFPLLNLQTPFVR